MAISAALCHNVTYMCVFVGVSMGASFRDDNVSNNKDCKDISDLLMCSPGEYLLYFVFNKVKNTLKILSELVNST